MQPPIPNAATDWTQIHADQDCASLQADTAWQTRELVSLDDQGHTIYVGQPTSSPQKPCISANLGLICGRLFVSNLWPWLS